MASPVAKLNDSNVTVSSAKAGEQSVLDVIAIRRQSGSSKSVVNLRTVVACKSLLENRNSVYILNRKRFKLPLLSKPEPQYLYCVKQFLAAAKGARAATTARVIMVNLAILNGWVAGFFG